MKRPSSVGMTLLCVWLILVGLAGTIGLSFQGFPFLQGLLALAAGILILLGR
jgi:hypothetical protein